MVETFQAGPFRAKCSLTEWVSSPTNEIEVFAGLVKAPALLFDVILNFHSEFTVPFSGEFNTLKVRGPGVVRFVET